jgi:ABC-type transport system substrate-binding protein
VVEWNTLFSSWRLGAKDPAAHGAHATNVSAATMDPFFAMVRFVSSKALPPVSNNWGYYTDEKTDALVEKARTTFEEQARNEALGELHANIVDEAPFLFVAHDVGPRAISPKVGNVVQPKSWFIDIATMTMD